MSGQRGRGLDHPISLDIQGTYDQARALACAWQSFAETLAEQGEICTHPEGERQVSRHGDTVHHICHGCDQIIKSVALVTKGAGDGE